MKRSFITVLAALMLAAAMLISPVSSVLAEAELPDLRAAWDGSIATSFAGGSGTASDPYRIANTPQLAYLAKRVNSGHNYAGKYFKLTSNLLINSTTGWENWYPENGPANKWTPIGTDDFYSFAGIFDGQDHTVKGLYFDYDEPLRGIFGVTVGATIKNLSVERSLIIGSGHCGAFVGKAYDTSFISCRNAGTVYIPGSSKMGGLVGACVGCEFTDCTNEGFIAAAESDFVGGIAGFAESTSFTNCVNTGSIYCSSCEATGGIAAYALYGCRAENCVNAGEIVCELDSSAGGIAHTFNGQIVGCANYGDITSRDGAAGIVVSNSYYEPQISDCYNEGHITAAHAFGIVTNHHGSGVTGCVNVGDITIHESSYGMSSGAGITGYSSVISGCINYGSIEGSSGLGINAGGIAVGVGRMEYCANYGDLTINKGCLGGIVCQLQINESVARCANLGSVGSGITVGVQGGGIIAQNCGSVTECANYAPVTCETAAGVAAYCERNAVLSDCFNAGDISGSIAGGIVYQARPNDLVRCYDSGTVEGSDGEDPIVALPFPGEDAEPVNCYFLDTSCDAEEPMGIPLTDAQMRLAASYAGFDFTNVWTIAGDEDYPYAELRWAYPDDPIPEEPFLLGDVNGDGAVDSSDALLLLRASMGLAELDEAQLSAGDVNGDGAADTTDALLILRLTLGLE